MADNRTVNDSITAAFPSRASVGNAIAKRIGERCPGWRFESKPQVWIATDTDEDYEGRSVKITAGMAAFATPFEMVERNVINVVTFGPIGDVRIQLPELVDRGDVDRVVNTLTAAGVIPDEHGMNH